MKAIHDTTRELAGKSPFGSHASMISEEETLKLVNKEKFVICKDEKGLYVTEKTYLDSGLADPNRFDSKEFRDEVYQSYIQVLPHPLN